MYTQNISVVFMELEKKKNQVKVTKNINFT